jgi:insulysin
VSTFAGNMHAFPPNLYLSGPSRIRGVEAEAVMDMVSQLTVDKMFLTIVSQTLNDKATKAEKWYKTQYATNKVTKQGLAKWTKPSPIASLALPAPNPFIPGDVTLKAPATEDMTSFPEGPTLVCEVPCWRVHYKGDRRYGQPKAYAYFNLKQPDSLFGRSTTPRTSAVARIFKASLADALNEYVYDANVAGLGFSIDFTPRATRLTFSGYNDKLGAFVETMAAALAQHRLTDEEKMARYKDQITRELKAFDNQQPYQHAAFYNQYYTSFPAFLPDQVVGEVERVTLRDVNAFADTVFRKCFGEVLVQGNVLEEEARTMIRGMEKALNFTELKRAEQAKYDLYLIPKSPRSIGTVIRNKEPNPNDKNSAVVVQFQHGDQDLKQQMALEVLASIFEQPFYADLRTKQQLGYIVSSGVKEQQDTRSLVFTVQSTFADALYLTDKVFAFVNSFEPQLAALTEEEVKGYIDGLVEQKMQKITRLSDETLRNWGEIVAGKYQYDRNLNEARATQELNKDFLLATWKSVVAEGGKERRVLTSQVLTQTDSKVGAKMTTPLPGGSVLAKSVDDFQRRATVINPNFGNAPAIEAQELGAWI